MTCPGIQDSVCISRTQVTNRSGLTQAQITLPAMTAPSSQRCMLWAKLHECEHNREAMWKQCRHACVHASSGHLPGQTNQALESLMTLPISDNVVDLQSVSKAGICDIAERVYGAKPSWLMQRPDKADPVDPTGLLHTYLTVVCAKPMDSHTPQGRKGTVLLKTDTRSGNPRVVSSLDRAAGEVHQTSADDLAALPLADEPGWLPVTISSSSSSAALSAFFWGALLIWTALRSKATTRHRAHRAHRGTGEMGVRQQDRTATRHRVQQAGAAATGNMRGRKQNRS